MKIITENIDLWNSSPLKPFADHWPWTLTENSMAIVEGLLSGLSSDYVLSDKVAVHVSAEVENGALIKGPAIVGPRCFIGSASLIRGGCWIDEDCIMGPGAELKSTFMFRGSKLAHFNFVGDSVIGQSVNLEAGSIIANYRNEFSDPAITFVYRGETIETGARKFGALVGDWVRIGANAVIAPGAILDPRTVVKRLTLVDQRPSPTVSSGS